jgi:hypothetical protein
VREKVRKKRERDCGYTYIEKCDTEYSKNYISKNKSHLTKTKWETNDITFSKVIIKGKSQTMTFKRQLPSEKTCFEITFFVQDR